MEPQDVEVVWRAVVGGGSQARVPRPHSAPVLAQQGHAGDGKQRPLVPRFRCLPRLMPSVDMTSDVKGWELLFYVLIILPVHFMHRKSRSQ
jgi:hypothetical protein